MFLDHDKDAYVKYRAYMREQQCKRWDTVEHPAHDKYKTLLPDLVLESTYRG
jgi:catechol O-methyltransferase